MSAPPYYSSQPSPGFQQQQHLLSPALSSPGMQHSGYPSGQSTPMKSEHYTHHSQSPATVDFESIQKAHEKDAILKSRIRKLRYLSRIISLLISIATLIPITMTLHKFLTTEHVFKTITDPSGNIVTRTAWFHDSKVWPTYMYFAVAAISVLLNLAILCSYMCSVEKANKVAAVASAFTWCVLIGNLVVWCVAAGIYRSEKDKGGKHDDLWGWTCSAPAKAIQKDFAEVPFDRFCTIQSASFYTGCVQVAAALLTVLIYIQVLMRSKTKKKVQRYSQMPGQYPTNY